MTKKPLGKVTSFIEANYATLAVSFLGAISGMVLKISLTQSAQTENIAELFRENEAIVMRLNRDVDDIRGRMQRIEDDHNTIMRERPSKEDPPSPKKKVFSQPVIPPKSPQDRRSFHIQEIQ